MGIITNMRNRMQVVMWTILVLFIISMAIGGLVGGASIGDIFGQQNGNHVGSLNGKPILYENFNRLVSDEITRVQSQSGQDISDEDREYIRAVVWERMIQDLLIQEQIEENNIIVSDEEVLYQLKNNPPAFLQGSPAFQTAGNFDLEKYLDAILNPQGDEWRPIEQFMQEIYLPNYKLQQMVVNSASTSKQDVIDSYKSRFIDYTVEILHITDKSLENEFFKSMTEGRPTDQELSELYDKNIEDYQQSEMRYMKYVKWPIVSSSNDSLRTRLEAENLMYRINQGESFGTIANMYTEDPSNNMGEGAPKGGELGWFNKGIMISEFDKAAFEAKKGDLIGPILTNFGYHIININDKKTLDDGTEQVNASHILLTVSPGKDTESNLSDTASIFSLDAKEIGFTQLADSLGMTINDASGVQKESIFIQDIGVARDAVRFAFNSDLGDISDVVSNDNFFLIFYLESITDKKTMDFDEVKEELKADFLTTIKENNIENIAIGISEELNGTMNLADISDKNPEFEYIAEDTGNLVGSFESIGKSNYVSGALLNASVNDILGPFPTLRGQTFIKVLEIGEINQSDFEEKKESLKFSLIIQRQNLIWGNWLQALRDQSDIEDYRFDFY
ncbi:MAG: SurA N-terminal domain-containing protein [Candidatus Marinimicrobia bacterium]|nr:SurA N-terminal domain-containing protein [Candidatus Neomarinimicrobiota bacterium]